LTWFVVLQNQLGHRSETSTSTGIQRSPSGSPCIEVATPVSASIAASEFQQGYGAKPSSLPTHRMVAFGPWKIIASGAQRCTRSIVGTTLLPSSHSSMIGP